MDRVKFVEDTLKNFTWFILEYLNPGHIFFGIGIKWLIYVLMLIIKEDIERRVRV